MSLLVASRLIGAKDMKSVPGKQTIRRLRKKYQMSQPAFAELLGVSVSTLRSWEQGWSRPRGLSLVALEAATKNQTKLI
jgi:putative transcriptional regulator